MPESPTLSQWAAPVVEIIAALFMVAMPFAVLYHRIKHGRPVANVRVIQLVALVLLMPSILIFGLMGKLESSTLGTLLAAIAGMFSGIANYAGPRQTGVGPAPADDDDSDGESPKSPDEVRNT